jgi:hypothetical protein
MQIVAEAKGGFKPPPRVDSAERRGTREPISSTRLFDADQGFTKYAFRRPIRV